MADSTDSTSSAYCDDQITLSRELSAMDNGNPFLHSLSGFESLPIELVTDCIVRYLGDTDVLALAQVNRILRQTLKSKCVRVIDQSYAQLFVSDDTFAKTVLSAGGILKIRASKCSVRTGSLGKQMPRPVHTIDLSGTCITDVSAYAGVNTADFSLCKRLTDVSFLAGLHELDLSECDCIFDVTELGNIRTLILSGCAHVTDVSALGRVHTLRLSNCQGVQDVSALGTVHTLDLANCNSIVDVSCLGNVHTLTLYGCRGIVDVSALGKVHSLDIGMCVTAQGVSALGGVHTLNVSGVDDAVNHVAMFSRVHTLDLSMCAYVTDVSALGGVYSLNLSSCLVADVSALGKVHTLTFSDNPMLTDVSQLTGVSELKLFKTKVSDVSALVGARVLFVGGSNVSDISALTGLRVAGFYNCPNLKDVSSLANAHSVVLERCPLVTDVSALSRVRLLGLTDCTGVTDVSALNNVACICVAGTSVEDVSFLTKSIVRTDSLRQAQSFLSSLAKQFEGGELSPSEFCALINRFVDEFRGMSHVLAEAAVKIYPSLASMLTGAETARQVRAVCRLISRLVCTDVVPTVEGVEPCDVFPITHWPAGRDLVDHVASAARKYPSNADLLGEACAAMFVLGSMYAPNGAGACEYREKESVSHKAPSTSFIISPNALEVVLQALHRFPSYMRLQLEGSGIVYLLTDTRESAAVVCAAGGALALVRVISFLELSADLSDHDSMALFNCCNALELMAQESTMRYAMIAEGVKIVLREQHARFVANGGMADKSMLTCPIAAMQTGSYFVDSLEDMNEYLRKANEESIEWIAAFARFVQPSYALKAALLSFRLLMYHASHAPVREVTRLAILACALVCESDFERLERLFDMCKEFGDLLTKIPPKADTEPVRRLLKIPSLFDSKCNNARELAPVLQLLVDWLFVSMDAMWPLPTIQPVSSADIQPVSASDIQPVSASDIQAVSSTDIQAVSASDIQPVSASDIQPVSSADIRAVSASDIQPSASA